MEGATYIDGEIEVYKYQQNGYRLLNAETKFDKQTSFFDKWREMVKITAIITLQQKMGEGFFMSSTIDYMSMALMGSLIGAGIGFIISFLKKK